MIAHPRRVLGLLAALVLTGLLVVLSLTADSRYSLHKIAEHAHQRLGGSTAPPAPKVVGAHTVVFPSLFSSDDLQNYYIAHFPAAAAKNPGANFVVGAGRSALPDTPAVELLPLVLDVYTNGDGRTVPDDKKAALCQAARRAMAVEVSAPDAKNVDIEALVKRLMDDPSEYVKEFMPFFEEDTKKQFAEHTIKDHWFRLAGLSVWLESHQVHFMISRVVYLSRGVRNAPSFSWVYAQVFTAEWKEIDGIELVVPTNSPDVGDELRAGQQYRAMRFPAVLPLPAYHSADHRDNRYYGPEDARILLVRNPGGYDEPLLVFNAYHRKVTETTYSSEGDVSLKFTFYRLMFVAWPWQQQRGKLNMEDLADPHHDRHLYVRSVELRRDNVPRREVQKNWTPFVSFADRARHGYDRYTYFLYRWSSLEVLRCDLTQVAGNQASCLFVYRMDASLDDNAAVGEMRGGTSLVSVNELLHRHRDTPGAQALLAQMPRDREAWVGFARAHLAGCGCGQDIYRPNFVVLTRDRDDKFKISHISSFAPLNVPVRGWYEDRPEACQEGAPSVFIPNGVSAWKLVADDSAAGFTDWLTMAYSIADASVEIIHIKNILVSFAALDASTLKVLAPALSRSRLPSSGFDDFNIECALEGSRQMCAAFGKENGKKEDGKRDGQEE